MPVWLEEMLIRLMSSRDAPTAAVARCAVFARLPLSDVVRDSLIALSSERTIAWALPGSHPTNGTAVDRITASCPVCTDESRSRRPPTSNALQPASSSRLRQ
jgi:hypothetical protein